jgi:hypothetical protein
VKYIISDCGRTSEDRVRSSCCLGEGDHILDRSGVAQYRHQPIETLTRSNEVSGHDQSRFEGEVRKRLKTNLALSRHEEVHRTLAHALDVQTWLVRSRSAGRLDEWHQYFASIMISKSGG